jgi:hypothetical protein
MTADMMMRVKDQVLIVLADYQSCKRDEIDERLDLNFEQEANRIAAEVAKRVMSNYKILTGRKNDLPFMILAQAAIEVYVLDQAKAKHDPWVLSRDEGTRIRAAYDISRIIEARAGKAHKFSVWSGIIYGATAKKLMPKRKEEDRHRGIRILIAAPSAKKAVETLNEVLGCNENLSNFRDHWSGGGTLGNKVATKIGIWAGVKDEQFAHTEKDWKLIWEPK